MNSTPRNTYRARVGATPSRLVRITDDDGDVCQLNAAAPGVLFDPITGNPIKVGTEKWLTAVERLGELVGYDDVVPLGEADRPVVRVDDRLAEPDGE